MIIIISLFDVQPTHMQGQEEEERIQLHGNPFKS